MHVRDAVEADAEAIASLADQPTAAARNLVHDRSVRVGVADDDGDSSRGDATEGSPAGDDAPTGPGEQEASEGDDTGDLLGFVAFDAEPSAVHVTGFGGTQAAIERLLGEPARFAAREGMPVEALVEAERTDRRSAIEGAGFEDVGAGPRFDGSATRRYRLGPESVETGDDR